MRKLVFATNNLHKIEEVNSILGDDFQLITLKEAGIDIEIPEPFNSLEENAYEKARVIHEMTGLDCFSEDTGLEVESLAGEPGVRSARYAGDSATAENNISKLLSRLDGKTDRTAKFRTVIHLILNNEHHSFEGICKGIIIAYKKGTQGFGYDPIFIPDGSDKTFAEMSLQEKNVFSHRGKAVGSFIEFLKNNKHLQTN